MVRWKAVAHAGDHGGEVVPGRCCVTRRQGVVKLRFPSGSERHGLPRFGGVVLLDSALLALTAARKQADRNLAAKQAAEILADLASAYSGVERHRTA
jgi:hypothetical protein